MLRSMKERISGRAVPRNVLDIPTKLRERKAPQVIIHRRSTTFQDLLSS